MRSGPVSARFATARLSASMNTDQLRLFSVIARHRSLSRAAAELDLGQATVSDRLRQLEAEVGTALFERQAARTATKNTLVDPAACRTYADTASGRVDERVREESGQGPKHANPLH